MGAFRRSRTLALVLAAALLSSLVGAVPVSAASSTFIGGPTDTVLFVPNDHTPIAFRFKATAPSELDGGTQYNVKVRFTVGTSPNPDTNRGMTWNGTTQEWVPDLGGSNWSDFPVVTTNADGSITEQWVTAKFADESVSGGYHVMISLSKVGSPGAINSSVVPAVTVMSMESGGAWVHNSTAVSGTLAAKRSECTSETSAGVVYSLGKTELDTVDSDANGIVDDEDYGPAGAAGDFHHAVPVDMSFNVLLSKTTTYAAARTITVPDTDIALNAADMIAPSSPASLLVTPGAYKNTLTWGAATDEGGSGIAGYRVYRREASGSEAYTMPWELIATTGSGVTTFDDTGLNKGVEYFYEVRAFDVATNAGPRSTGSGTPVSVAPVAVADSYTVTEDSVLTSAAPGVLLNDTDADGDILTASLASDVSHGVLTLNADGSFTYTPEADYSGPDSFTYHANDGMLDSNTVTVDITVTAVNDAPVAAADAYATNADTTLTVAAKGVLANDGDADDDALTAVLVSDAGHGALTLDSDGAFEYVPVSGYTGVDSFTYKANDGTVDSNTAIVTVTVGTPGDVLEVEIAGATRFDTAIKASMSAFTTSEYVLIATGMNWPDALGGSALAGALDAPILLTRPDSLYPEVIDEIQRLKATKAIILGGTPAVSAAVASAIDAIDGVSVERISGTNRYETAKQVAKRAIAELEANGGYDGTAFVATGANFPDALGASPLAAAMGWPIYLANPALGSNASLVATMGAEGVTDALVLGGTNVVGTSVETALETLGSATRLAGTDRYKTAIEVASYGVANADLGWNKVAFATGTNFPDALAGGVLQGRDGSVLLLTPGTSLNASVAATLTANRASIFEVRYLGSTSAISQTVRNQVISALE